MTSIKLFQQVKAIYVKNLPKNVAQDQLRELFGRHGDITKIILPPAKLGQEKSRIGFIHFTERSSAMKALKNTEKYELDGDLPDLYFNNSVPSYIRMPMFYLYLF